MRNNQGLLVAIISGITLIAILPYIMMVICCFSTSAGIKGNDVFSNISIQNFIFNLCKTFENKQFVISLINSSFVSICSSVIGIMISSIAGYSCSIYNRNIFNRLFYFTSFAMYIPTATILIPLFIVLKATHLLDTYLATIISSLSTPFLVFLFRQNAKTFPKDIIAAARIDGANELSIFLGIFVPYMKPVFITSAMIAFFNAWNSVLIPVVILQSQNKFTNAIYLSSLSSVLFSDYAVLMMSLLISTLPTILIFMIFQRYIKNSFI